MKRRTFLQKSGLALTALGLSQVEMAVLAQRYAQVLAQPTARKLALLVGINQYSDQLGGQSTPLSLNGCVTDVELQRELLIHRFGWRSADIVTLTDAQATRQTIETAFVTHLIEQARAGDVVLFHFSGYGGRVHVPGAIAGLAVNATSEHWYNSLVPADGIPSSQETVVEDVLVTTLTLLLRSLATRLYTVVLDTCHESTDEHLPRGWRVRSRPYPDIGLISAAELAFQEQWCQKIPMLANAQGIGTADQLAGVLLRAAIARESAASSPMDGSGTKAFEVPVSGFSAGVFTYTLTQQLWQSTPPLTVSVQMRRATTALQPLVGREQQPQIIGQGQAVAVSPSPLPLPLSADGVVIAVDDHDREAEIWLAGLPLSVLEGLSPHSLLMLSEPATLTGTAATPTALKGKPDPTLMVVRSREGLRAKVKVVNADQASSPTLQVGQWVQEAVRVLPRKIGLAIALDSHLARIERIDATSALAGISYLSMVSTADQPIDYVLGRVQTPVQLAALSPSTVLNDLPLAKASYGLFPPGQTVLTNTQGNPGEAIKVAAQRLLPQLQMLLAAKVLRLLHNSASSRLGVKVTLQRTAVQPQSLMEQVTWRAPWQVPASFQLPPQSSGSQALSGFNAANSKAVNPLTLPIGSRIQCSVHNYSDRPIYLMAFGIDHSTGTLTLGAADASLLSYAVDSRPRLCNPTIPPGDTLILPCGNPELAWVVRGPNRLQEIQIICSLSPFTQTLNALNAGLSTHRDAPTLDTPLPNPLEVAEAIVQDLHQASLLSQTNFNSSSVGAITTSATNPPSDTVALNVNAWAAFNFIYHVV